MAHEAKEVREERRMLVLLKLGDSTPQRLTKIVPTIMEVLQRSSLDRVEQAFRSTTADLLGYLILSRLAPHKIRGALESPPKPEWPILNNKDSILVLEVGERFSGNAEFTRATTWLQHH